MEFLLQKHFRLVCCSFSKVSNRRLIFPLLGIALPHSGSFHFVILVTSFFCKCFRLNRHGFTVAILHSWQSPAFFLSRLPAERATGLCVGRQSPAWTSAVRLRSGRPNLPESSVDYGDLECQLMRNSAGVQRGLRQAMSSGASGA